MRLIYEVTEIVGRAVESGRREEVDAIIPPAKGADEVGHRHHFQHPDAKGL